MQTWSSARFTSYTRDVAVKLRLPLSYLVVDVTPREALFSHLMSNTRESDFLT